MIRSESSGEKEGMVVLHRDSLDFYGGESFGVKGE